MTLSQQDISVAQAYTWVSAWLPLCKINEASWTLNIFPLLSENTFPIMVNVRYPEGAVQAAYRRRPPPSDPHDVAIAVNKHRLWGNLWSYRGTSNTAYRTKQGHMYRQRNTNITAPGGARGTGISNNRFYGSHNDMKNTRLVWYGW